jgi:hemoglobin
MTTMYERVGGEAPIRAFIEVFHATALSDPLLRPAFQRGGPSHVDHLVLFITEMFGGPAGYTAVGGTAAMLIAHRNLEVTEDQRGRFVDLMLAAADATGLCDDDGFRQKFAEHLTAGSHLAVRFSQPDSPVPQGPFPPIQPWSWSMAGPEGS